MCPQVNYDTNTTSIDLNTCYDNAYYTYFYTCNDLFIIPVHNNCFTID